MSNEGSERVQCSTLIRRQYERVQLRLFGDSVPSEGSKEVQQRLLGCSVPTEGSKRVQLRFIGDSELNEGIWSVERAC